MLGAQVAQVEYVLETKLISIKTTISKKKLLSSRNNIVVKLKITTK